MNRFDWISVTFCLLAITCCVVGYYSFVIWPHRPQPLGYYLVWWWLAGAVMLLVPAGYFLYRAERIRP